MEHWPTPHRVGQQAMQVGSWQKTAFSEGYFGQGIVLDGSNYVAISSGLDREARDASITVATRFRVDSRSGR